MTATPLVCHQSVCFAFVADAANRLAVAISAERRRNIIRRDLSSLSDGHRLRRGVRSVNAKGRARISRVRHSARRVARAARSGRLLRCARNHVRPTRVGSSSSMWMRPSGIVSRTVTRPAGLRNTTGSSGSPPVPRQNEIPSRSARNQQGQTDALSEGRSMRSVPLHVPMRRTPPPRRCRLPALRVVSPRALLRDSMGGSQLLREEHRHRGRRRGRRDARPASAIGR